MQQVSVPGKKMQVQDTNCICTCIYTYFSDIFAFIQIDYCKAIYKNSLQFYEV